jgi:cleavage stimulation factor subunit 3
MLDCARCIYKGAEVLRTLPEELQAQIPSRTLNLIIKHRIRIKDENRWDLDTWNAMINDCRDVFNESGLGDLYRLTLEDLLQLFPTSVKYWRELIQFEIKQGRIEQTKELFRCVLSKPLLFAPLWQDYISFIRDVHQTKGLDLMLDLKRAFEFTLNKLEYDLESGPIWIEYLNTLLSIRSSTYNSENPSALTDSISKIREAFHRCLTIPHSALEHAFTLYEKYEAEVANLDNKQKKIGINLISQLIPRYKVAKTQFISRRFMYDDIKLDLLAIPPFLEGPVLLQQQEIWRKILKFERSNPQRLVSKDLHLKVNFTFEQALIPLYRHPEVWLQYVQHMSCSASHSSYKDALNLLERAILACPHNSALRFMQVELLEQAGDKTGAKEIYERLCTEIESGCDLLNTEQSSLIWIHYMYFLRRLEEPIKSRELFLRAKNWKGCNWQVYTASAMMEWRSHEMGDATQKVTKKIFEKGLEKFYAYPDYINSFAIWLMGIGDESAVKSLYERTLDKLTLEEITSVIHHSSIIYQVF